MKIINKKEAGIGPFFKEAMLHQFSHHTLPDTNRSFFCGEKQNWVGLDV